jgi:hypothetical protein
LPVTPRLWPDLFEPEKTRTSDPSHSQVLGEKAGK